MSRYSEYDFGNSISSEKERRRYNNSSYRSTYSSSVGTTSFSNYVMIFLKYSFFTVLLVFVSFVFLLILQSLGFKVYSLTPEDGGAIIVPGPTNRQIVMNTSKWPANKEAELANLVAYNYTISIDVFITNTIVDQSVPRVILYRSRNPVTLVSTDKSINSLSSTKMSDTNFILYLDPHKNDLMADVYLNDANSTKLSIPPIENLPIQRPFRITMMLSNNLLEIYINGELQKSLPFNNGKIPRDVDTQSKFYGPPDFVGHTVLVSKVSYWATILSSKAIRVYGNEPFNTSVFTIALAPASTS
jgi:hypothetical protein